MKKQRASDRWRAEEGPTEEQQDASRYYIDLAVESERNQALSMLVGGRRCFQCQQGESVESVTAADPTEHMERIATHCSQTSDYLLPDTPLKEAIFRALLAGENRPMTAAEIGNELGAKWAMSAHTRDISPDVLKVLLNSSQSYRIVRVPDPEPVEEKTGGPEDGTG